MTRTFAIAAAVLAFSAGAAAAACSSGKAAEDMSHEEAQAVYDCLAADMHAGYVKGNKRWIPKAHVEDYRGWKLANTAPAAPGFHGSRFLMTFVNEAGYDAYTEFKEEDVTIPAGTVIAKESFSVDGKGDAKAGPLFIMEKVEAGSSAATDDWHYMMVDARGRPQAINVMQACHACHAENFGDSGGLGYPVEEVRVAR